MSDESPDGATEKPAGGWLARRLSWAADDAVPERYRLEIGTDLLDETLTLANVSAITHFAVAVAITGLFWNSAPQAYLVGLFATVTAVIAITLYTNRLYRRTYRDGVSEVGVARGTGISAGLALVLGLAWATMPIMLFAPANNDQRLLIVATAAGLIFQGPVTNLRL